MRIVVVGGSGLVGAKLVSNLRHRGHDVLAASPHTGVESGYFRAKMRQEYLTRASLIPHTILRAAQFFEFMPRVLQSDADERAVRVSPAFVQPIASEEVAAALTDLATAALRNGMIEFAGPECFRLDEAVHRLMQITQDSRALVADPQARYFGARLSEDTLTPDEGAIIGVARFDDCLKEAGGAHALN